MKRLCLIFCLLWPIAGYSQSWPIHENLWVNDYANVIETDTEARIIRTLQTLKEETGVEATVLTLFTRWGYESAGSFEDFATGLFNHWGIGDADKNDGILIMIISEDREMRIELGAGYPDAFDREAQDIINDSFLPAFQDGRMGDGIEAGTNSIVTHIARAHAAGEAPAGKARGIGGLVFGGGILAALIAMIFGRKIGNRFKHCPKCGQRGIRTARVTDEKATKTSTGSGTQTTTCTNCDYHGTKTYSISRISTRTSSSGSSFGGGSSSGGGASGRW